MTVAVERILSRNAAFQRLVALKTNRTRRLREGLLWVEGVRNINAAIEHGWQCDALLYAVDAERSRWAQAHIAHTAVRVHYALAAPLLAELSGKDEGSELLALVTLRERRLAEFVPAADAVTVLFDRPASRGNLGSVIRSCDALGISALFVFGHGVDLYDPETLGASMGSFFALPTCQVAGNDELDTWIAAQRTRLPGFQVVGTSAHGDVLLPEVDLKRPALILLGNETSGLSRRLADACDVLARIPMRAGSGASSLNVANAASVIFYEVQRQRM